MNPNPLTMNDEKLLEDLAKRPPWLGTVNAGFATAVLCALVWIAPGFAAHTAAAALCGALIGVFFEQRHLSRLGAIIAVLRSANDSRTRSRG